MKKRRRLKRVISACLALILCFGCGTIAFAQDTVVKTVLMPDLLVFPPELLILLLLPTALENLPSALYDLLREKTEPIFDAIEDFFWNIWIFFEDLFDR